MSSEANKIKKFTIEEVKKHHTFKDCWIIIDNKVYNVTDFVPTHPGGDDIILENAGAIATEEFEKIGHSESAYELLSTFYIGDLETSS